MKNQINKISLLSLFLVIGAVLPVDAKVSVKNSSNRSYSEAYQQINAMRYQQDYSNTATTASATENLPVAVSDEKLAESILNNTAENVNVSDLEACSMIYPNGVFRWEIPESGIRNNQVPQCVAVVELRDANTNVILATTTVAAGDSLKCNIDSFPESNMNATALAKTELPADAAPTIQDVEAVMNQENKQNAGFKIAAGAIISGIAGNLLAPKEAGDTKMFGTGKTQLVDTAIGAAAGAGIMAASSYSGKVAGDTIKSTAVNAASGMIVGNMLAGTSSGNSIIATTKCKLDSGEVDCIIGTCAEKSNETINNGQKGTETTYHYFINFRTCKEMLKCTIKEQTNGTYTKCSQENMANYIDVMVEMQSGSPNTKLCSSLKDSEYTSLSETYKHPSSDDPAELERNVDQNPGVYALVASATITNGRKHAYAVMDLGTKPFGYKLSDWTDTLSKQGGIRYFNRNSDGTVGDAFKDCTFEPKTRDADDGGLIDLSNQARAKGTMIGAGVGGAMGGFAGYQGAKSEVTDRWTAAVREYEDSLSNFVCMTGGRYLSKYNDYADIPTLKKTEQ